MEKVAFIIFLAALVISPLLFGAVHTYAYTFIFLCIFAASLLLVRSNIVRESKKLHFRWINTSLNPLFIGIFFLLIFQMIPLPDFLLVRLSQGAKIAGDMSLPAYSVLETAGLKGYWYALAPYIYPVRMSLIGWIVYGLLFFGLTQTLNSRKRIEFSVIAILIICCFETLYGIIQTYSGSNHIWWFKNISDFKSVNGTYINRNHFAGLMEMGVVLAIAYAGALAEKSAGSRKQGRSKNILKYLSTEKLFTRRFLIIYAGVVIGLGLFLSGSRGGIIAAAGALLFMGLLFFFKKSQRRMGLIILIFFLLTSIYALVAGIDYTVGRFQMLTEGYEGRLRSMQNTLNLFADYPLAGVGVGNYMYAFPKSQPADDKNIFIDFTENDWIQFMADAGILGLIILLAGIAYYFFTVLKVWKTRQDSFAVCLGIAPVAAMTAIGIHSNSDFNLHIPANFMMLVAITAIGYSALHLERHHSRDKMQYRYYSWPLQRGGIAVLAVFLIVILWSGIWTLRHFFAEAYCSTVPNSTMNLDQNPPAEKIWKAIAWDPGNAAYRYKLARELMSSRDKEMQATDRDMDRWHEWSPSIIAALEKAIRLNPFRAEYHMHLGWQYSYQWNQPDYMEKWFPAADVSMERAAYFSGIGAENPHVNVDLGNYWTMRSTTIDPSDSKQEIAWTKAVWHYKKALEFEKSKKLVEEISRNVKSFYPDEEHLKEIMDGGM